MSRGVSWSPAPCSAWCTASPTRPRTAGTRRPPTDSSPPAWRLAGVRGLAGPGRQHAAAAPRGARPQPGRRLRLDAHRHGRAVRDLLVLDLLSAADTRVLAARHRLRVPADERRP